MSFYVLLPFYAALTAVIARGRDPRSWMRIELTLLSLLAALSLVLSGPPSTSASTTGSSTARSATCTGSRSASQSP